jgi:ribose transport system ATP-binding protein
MNSPEAVMPPVLSVRGVGKSYGGARALVDASLDLKSGEIHALVGANGAGKSTLIKILAGLVVPDTGTIVVAGQEVEPRSPADASEAGLAFIHQELNLVETLTAFENISLGFPAKKVAGIASWAHLRPIADRWIRELGLHVDLDKQVSTLTPAQKVVVAVCRAVMRDARVIAMDEPTASLSGREVDALLEVCRRLSAAGVAILYVSHRLEEVVSLCNRATVFRDGSVVDRIPEGEITKAKLVTGIVGRALGATAIPPRHGSVPLGDVCLEVNNLSREPAVDDVSFVVRRTEVVGLAGLVGAGRTELARLIIGADRADSGTVRVHGKLLAPRTPRRSQRLGLGLVPEERRTEGLILDQSVTFNTTLGWPRRNDPAWRRWWRSPRKLRRSAQEIGTSISLKTSSYEQPVSTLSGGNQQRVVMGRWLGQGADVLLLDEPTRGVDIGAREQLHSLVRAHADRGAGVLVISSDFEELVGCDRVLVMARSRIVAELHRGEITEDAMVLAAFNAELAESEGI